MASGILLLFSEIISMDIFVFLAKEYNLILLFSFYNVNICNIILTEIGKAKQAYSNLLFIWASGPWFSKVMGHF